MNHVKAIQVLTMHRDPAVRAAATVLDDTLKRKSRIMKLVQEALGQLRLDIKYLQFDRDCLKRERDEARGYA